ncbi:MAG: TetR/AcrR family transcriptional regulator C-terminal domain-containing protein [Algicola sp.]|nr:TetR/AcrR family transcriptional regulator C-terminal domain-containing protein [Algicola sp.]
MIYRLLYYLHPHRAILCMVKGEVSIQSELNVEKRLRDETVTAYVHSCVAMFLRGYAA